MGLNAMQGTNDAIVHPSVGATCPAELPGPVDAPANLEHGRSLHSSAVTGCRRSILNPEAAAGIRACKFNSGPTSLGPTPDLNSYPQLKKLTWYDPKIVDPKRIRIYSSFYHK